jgi:hypothetical protein
MHRLQNFKQKCRFEEVWLGRNKKGKGYLKVAI